MLAGEQEFALLLQNGARPTAASVAGLPLLCRLWLVGLVGQPELSWLAEPVPRGPVASWPWSRSRPLLGLVEASGQPARHRFRQRFCLFNGFAPNRLSGRISSRMGCVEPRLLQEGPIGFQRLPSGSLTSSTGAGAWTRM